MELFGVGPYSAVQSGYAPQKSASAAPQTDAPAEEKTAVAAGTDTVTLSENAEKFIERVREKNREAAGKLEELLGKAEESGELALGDEEMNLLESSAKALEEAAPAQDAGEADEEAPGDQSGVSGRVGINAAKLARMLAAAKTRTQVQAVIAKIEADLDECEAGKQQGMDVDEASVKAAENLLQEAKSRLSSAENREATPEEEMASALASLM